jgi:hypothetical protein
MPSRPLAGLFDGQQIIHTGGDYTRIGGRIA